MNIKLMIKEGDRVMVHMSRNDIFTFQFSTSFCARILSMPRGAGDMIAMQVELFSDPIIHINGNSSEFIGMTKINEIGKIE